VFRDHPKYYVDMPMTIASMDQGIQQMCSWT
jgi:hypothetical protein